MIDRDKIQDDLDILLIFMNDQLEQSGHTIKTMSFDFSQNSHDGIALSEQNKWTFEELVDIIKVAIARNLITHSTLGAPISSLILTTEGQARAISSAYGKDRSYDLGSEPSIHTINVHGSAQIGNGNIQSFGARLESIGQQIDQSNCSQHEKSVAKQLWQEVLNNPLLSSVLRED